MFGGNRTCIMTVRDALNVCEMTGSRQIGVAVDVYHVWWDSQLENSLKDAHGRILGYHLCDWLEDTSHMLLDRGMMGDGVADLKSIRRWVEQADMMASVKLKFSQLRIGGNARQMRFWTVW